MCNYIYHAKPVHFVHIWLPSLKRYLLQNPTKLKLNTHKKSDRGTHTQTYRIKFPNGIYIGFMSTLGTGEILSSLCYHIECMHFHGWNFWTFLLMFRLTDWNAWIYRKHLPLTDSVIFCFIQKIQLFFSISALFLVCFKFSSSFGSQICLHFLQTHTLYR